MQTTLKFTRKSAVEDTSGESDSYESDDKSDVESSVDTSAGHSGGVVTSSSSDDIVKDLPTYWSKKMWMNKKSLYPWLFRAQPRILT